MKKQLLTLFSCMLVAQAVSAQKPDSAQAMVHYKFTWLRDTTQRDKPYTENMVLFVGQNASVYKSYDKKLQADLMKKQIQEQMASGAHNFNVSSRGESTSSEYFQFPNENKLIRKESLMTAYLIEEPFPIIKWKIKADTSTIGNLHCQKAMAHFKGRDYTAWFCSELPYRAGPWKLSGLPGLIVEAYDTKKEVVFKFDGIDPVIKTNKVASAATAAPQPGMRMIAIGGDDPNADPNLIALPDNGVKTTEKEFDNLKEAMRKDPNAFIQSAMGGSGMAMKPNPNMKTDIRISSGPKTVINNPIELPEKK
ncbi:GLPGLI family protein [uncultured Mucilaginibacter sp.]|uniref:GLPGLI family protein n=1 Tax=uncultured Mucilaginibacter sp. TaxID=797541 RepID=UPI0025F4DDA0|nr:GLPGLI family protein [uncultured Mucilaginibacter sp.]